MSDIQWILLAAAGVAVALFLWKKKKIGVVEIGVIVAAVWAFITFRKKTDKVDPSKSIDNKERFDELSGRMVKELDKQIKVAEKKVAEDIKKRKKNTAVNKNILKKLEEKKKKIKEANSWEDLDAEMLDSTDSD